MEDDRFYQFDNPASTISESPSSDWHWHDQAPEPFTDDFDRQFIDATHPLYVSPASTAPAAFTSSGNDDLDPAYHTVVRRNQTNELGAWGKCFVYSWFALGAAYFGFIFIFGAH